MWNPSRCDCESVKRCVFSEYLDINICAWKKHIFNKLVLACKDEIVNTSWITSNRT